MPPRAVPKLTPTRSCGSAGEYVSPGVGEGEVGGGDGELRVAVEALDPGGGKVSGGVEVVHFARTLGAEVGGVEAGERGDAGSLGEEASPERVFADADASDGAEAGDNGASWGGWHGVFSHAKPRSREEESKYWVLAQRRRDAEMNADLIGISLRLLVSARESSFTIRGSAASREDIISAPRGGS